MDMRNTAYVMSTQTRVMRIVNIKSCAEFPFKIYIGTALVKSVGNAVMKNILRPLGKTAPG